MRWLNEVLCWSYTKFKLSACKTRGHIRTFQRYFDLLAQKASRLLFITTITVKQWILDAVWQASSQGWENIGSQAIMRKKMIFCIHRMEVEKPFSCIGQSTSDEKWDIINDWNCQNEQTLCRLKTRFFDKLDPKSLLAAKKIEMHGYTIIKSYEQTLAFVAAIHAQSSEEHNTPLISLISFWFPKRWLF